ncbi:MAG: SDR family NAD(P)-dependent oxidoreductase, partial [Anaerolineae bacterium]|nr:SDR family NAD(P)-dependent oxidoreductase [Anaerolineae bacterium]
MAEKRIALVTGASRKIGIGAAVCRALAAQRLDVAFTHWSPYDATMPWGKDHEAVHELLSDIKSTGVRAFALEADLTQPDSARTILDAVEAELGMVSILVNNATYSTNGDYTELDAAMLDAHYAVNIRGAFLLTVAFARRFNGEHGRIINLTSGQSLGPMSGELAYAATKGAVEAFTLSLAGGVADKKITVNAVDPGPTDTGWMDDELKDILRPRFPTNRIGMPEDVARLIAFLVSED